MDPAAIANTPTFYYTEPQNWNTASYTTNNPIKYIDPDGCQSLIFGGQSGCSGFSSCGVANLQQTLNQAAITSMNVFTSGVLAITGGVPAVAVAGPETTAAGAAWLGKAALPYVGRAAMSPSSILGGLSNTVERAYFDYTRDGSIDDSLGQYAGSYGFGAIGGRALSSAALPKTIVGAGASEALENTVLDGGINYSSVTGNSIGAGLSKMIFGRNLGPVVHTGIAGTLSRIQQSIAELGVTIGATEFVNSMGRQIEQKK